MKKRTTITVHPELYKIAKDLMTSRHFTDFSTFVEQLIREEHERHVAIDSKLHEEMTRLYPDVVAAVRERTATEQRRQAEAQELALRELSASSDVTAGEATAAIRAAETALASGSQSSVPKPPTAATTARKPATSGAASRRSTPQPSPVASAPKSHKP